jgi:hypothetical protein
MKKDSERYYLKEFLKLMPELQGLKPIDSEGPDFLCDVVGTLTGVEVTRFFFPTAGRFPPQAAEAYRSRLTSELRDEHLNSTITPVHVSVYMYRDDALLKPNQRSALKKELFAFVAHRIPPPGPHIEFDSESLSQSLCEKGVDSIVILHHTKLTRPYWSFPYASAIPESSSSIVQGIIDKKARLVPKYRKRADRLWLLILSGTDGLHSTVYFDNDVLTHKYSTDFDRLFLFCTFGASAHELKRF